MRDRSMRSGTKLAREIQPTDWSTVGNLSNLAVEYKYGRVIFVLVLEIFVLYEVQLDNKSYHESILEACLAVSCSIILYMTKR